MDQRLLEAFRTVFEHGSVTHAATIIGITQPAVSAQLARLEEEVGFALFERIGNRLRPTAEANIFYAEVERTLSSMSALSRVAGRIRDGETGSLVIASHPSAGISLLPPVIARFVESRPQVRVQLYTRNSEVVRGLFPSRAFDLGITEMPVDPAGLTVTRHQMDCVAILPKGHPLAGEESITPEMLADQPFIAISRERTTHHRVMSVFAERGLPFRIVVETEFFASICGLVANGLGVSVIDPATAEEFAPLGLVTRPFTPAVSYEFAVFHSADREPSRLARDFLTALEAHIARFANSAKVRK